MPSYNKTARLKGLYYSQHSYFQEPEPEPRPADSLFPWPENDYLKFDVEKELINDTLMPQPYGKYLIAGQVFGQQKARDKLSLKRLVNMIQERAQLHYQHIQEINHRHMQFQKYFFGAQINHNEKRQGQLERALLQLDSDRRKEELDFWKDKAELREKIFEAAKDYSSTSHRYSLFADLEGINV